MEIEDIVMTIVPYIFFALVIAFMTIMISTDNDIKNSNYIFDSPVYGVMQCTNVFYSDCGVSAECNGVEYKCLNDLELIKKERKE